MSSRMPLRTKRSIAALIAACVPVAAAVQYPAIGIPAAFVIAAVWLLARRCQRAALAQARTMRDEMAQGLA